MSAYAMRGKRICKDGFISVSQVSATTLDSHRLDVSSNESFSKYQTQRDSSRIGKLRINQMAVRAFLKRYSEQNGLTCPPGHRSTKENPVRVLPSDTIKWIFTRNLNCIGLSLFMQRAKIQIRHWRFL